MMRLKEFFQDLDKRETALVIFTGLMVAWVRHGLQHHWHGWDSWESFFLSWFVHTIAVVLLMGAGLAAIFFSHKFFRGYDCKQDARELMFYIVVTTLVAALGIAFVANSPPRDDYDDSSAIVIFFG